MLYMIEVKFKQERRAEILDYFWKHGTSQYEGKISVLGAWVASKDMQAYVLVESASDAEVNKACAPLSDFGEFVSRHVTSTEEI